MLFGAAYIMCTAVGGGIQIGMFHTLLAAVNFLPLVGQLVAMTMSCRQFLSKLESVFHIFA